MVQFRIPIWINTLQLENIRVLLSHIQATLEDHIHDVKQISVVFIPPSNVQKSLLAHRGHFIPWSHGLDGKAPAHLHVSFLAHTLSLVEQVDIKTKAIQHVMQAIEAS